MPPSLTGVNAKLERANEHADTLKREVDGWLNSQPCRLVREVDPDFRRFRVILRIDKPPDLKRWAMLLGDAIHNLRSSLDHLIYAIALHEDGDVSRDVARNLLFVIKDKPEDFRSEAYHIASLSSDVRAAIESVQPYNRRNPELPPLLSVLRDLDDADKHRLLSVLLIHPTDADFDRRAPFVDGQEYRIEIHKGPLEDGLEVASLTLSIPQPEMDFNLIYSLAVAIRHAPGPKGHEWTGINAVMPELLIPEVRAVIDIVRAAAK